MKKSSNKQLLWFVASIMLIALGLLAATYYFHLGPFSRAKETGRSSSNAINYDAPTDSQVKEGSETKQEVIEGPKQDEQSKNETSTSEAGIDITVAEKSGDLYLVRALIQDVSSGTCTINMVGPDNMTYNETVDVQPMANASTCKGFNIPMDKLSPGAWTISVTYSDGEESATTKKEVAI